MGTPLAANWREEIERPYIRVRRRASCMDMEGVASHSLGLKIEPAKGAEQGIFAEWNWDGARLVVRNDRYGFFPLFYFHDQSGICVSPSIVRLLDRDTPPRLNAAGLAVFLRLGWFIGDETPFEGIRALPPGAMLQWQDGVCRVASKGPLIARSQHLSSDQAKEGYLAHFRVAMRRLAPPSDNFVVPLSGGRDSRHILFELHEMGLKPEACITQKRLPAGADEADEDVAIARQLCRALGIPHVVVDQMPSKLSAELRKNTLTQFCALEHAWGLPFADCVSERWNYLYDGIGGDVLSAGLFMTEKRLTLFETGDFVALANEILGPEGYLPKLLPASKYKLFSRDLAIEQLVLELSRHADAPNPVGSFYFYNRTRRTIALGSLCMLGRKARILMPYLDHDLYDFLSSLPARALLDHEFHTQTIQRGYPRYSHIPFESKRQPVPRNTEYFRRFALECAKYSLQEPKVPLVRRSSLALRVLRSFFDTSYSTQIVGFGPIAVYLQQLGELTQMNS